MALISDPTVVAFCNEVIRPVADRMVGLDVTCDTEILRWNDVISPLISGLPDTDIIDDGSDLDGRTTLTKADVDNFVTQMVAYQSQLNGVGVASVISKPKVNTILP